MTGQSGDNASDHTRRRRGRIILALITAGCLLVLGGIWLGVTAVMARSQLNAIRAQAHTLGAQLSASNWPAARATAADIATRAHRANQLTSGPAWALGAAVPYGGEPLQAIRGLTAGADSLGHDALPQLINAGQQLNPRTLRRPDGSIDLARIAAAGPAIASASDVVAQTTKTISALPRHTWVSSIDAAYSDALSQVSAIDSSLKSADLAVKILPTMLGAGGPK